MLAHGREGLARACAIRALVYSPLTSGFRYFKEKTMARIAIEKVAEEGEKTSSAVDEVKALQERTRQRAFELFEMRGGGDGLAVNPTFAPGGY
jgi:hypothetical protein